jgi:hypothetical protein
MRHEKCPPDPTYAEFDRVTKRYQNRVVSEYDDWELDSFELPSEKAHEVDTFFFRVGNRAVLIKLDPNKAARISETSDPHLIQLLDSRFRELVRLSKKRGAKENGIKRS